MENTLPAAPHSLVIEPALPLPMSLGQITAEWLTGALRETVPGARVSRLDIVDVLHGTCTKVRLRVEAEGIALPETLMLKAGLEPHSREWRGMHETEVRGYREMLPALGLASPHCWYAAYSTGQAQGAIVMEDLVASRVRFCDARRPENLPDTQARLLALADFHAQTWQAQEAGDRKTPRFGPGGSWTWLENVMDQSRDYFGGFLHPDVWNRYVGLPRGAAVSPRFHDAAWMADALERMCQLARRAPHCVLHGDTHSGNLYFAADGTPGFFDSLPAHGPGISEVAYHLVCALDVPDRRAWERNLVALYLDRLAARGVAVPELDQAMADYAVYLARAYVVFLVNASEFQDEAVNTAYTARISAAMLDHDTAGRLARIC